MTITNKTKEVNILIPQILDNSTLTTLSTVNTGTTQLFRNPPPAYPNHLNVATSNASPENHEQWANRPQCGSFRGYGDDTELRDEVRENVEVVGWWRTRGWLGERETKGNKVTEEREITMLVGGVWGVWLKLHITRERCGGEGVVVEDWTQGSQLMGLLNKRGCFHSLVIGSDLWGGNSYINCRYWW